MKIIIIIFISLLSSCIKIEEPIIKQVTVIEILRMEHRSTYFKGNDSEEYEVFQESYKVGDTMSCLIWKKSQKTVCHKIKNKRKSIY